MNPELSAKIDGRRVIASISGGKDSAALSLWLTEHGVVHDRVFMDTKWEQGELGRPSVFYDFLRGDLTRKIGPITEIGNPLGMEGVIRKKGMFPSRQRRFCTEELKVFPMQAHLETITEEVVNAVGIRRVESTARKDAKEWEWSETFDCEVWRPLVTWTLGDVLAIHKRHGLGLNPLYLPPYNALRVGCWPCIMARKSEIRTIAANDPARISRLRILEEEVGELAHSRYLRDSEAWRLSPDPEPSVDDVEKHKRWSKKKRRLTSPFVSPAWFQDPIGRVGTMPIDKVVEWSKTARGGRQYELFQPGVGEDGCMRAGLCETPAEDDTLP